MSELHLQDKFLIPFFRESLGYQEVKANTDIAETYLIRTIDHFFDEVPFDSYTMNEAIKDGFILNPLKNIVPVASKMLFDLPSNELEGFEAPNYKDADKKQIYENRDRIHGIAQYIADLLVKDVYRQIRGTGKAMLAVYSIKAAIAYKQAVTQQFNELVKQPKYAKYADARIYIIYSSNQDEQSATGTDYIHHAKFPLWTTRIASFLAMTSYISIPLVLSPKILSSLRIAEARRMNDHLLAPIP
jgi:hypothetical protein